MNITLLTIGIIVASSGFFLFLIAWPLFIMPSIPEKFFEDESYKLDEKFLKKRRAKIMLRLYSEYSAINLTFIGIILMSLSIRYTILGIINIGIILAVTVFLFMVLYTVKSIVFANRKGMIETNRMVLGRLGEYGANLEKSAQLVPQGLYEVVRVTRKEIVNDFPAEPSKIDYENQDQPAEGKVSPWRILTGGEKDSKDELKNAMTLEQEGSHTFSILNPLLFVLRVGDVDEVNQQMNRTTLQTVGDEYIENTPLEVFKKHKEIREKTVKVLEKILKGWGIEFSNDKFTLKRPDLGHRINVALKEEAENIIRNRIKIAASLATKDEKINIGKGVAEAEFELQNVVVRVAKELQDKLNIPDAYAWLLIKTAMDGIKSTDKTILGIQGALEPLGFSKALMEKAQEIFTAKTATT